MAKACYLTVNGDGGPPTIFYNDEFKNWSKIHRMCTYNFGAKGRNIKKLLLFHVTCRGAGMIIWVQLFGGLHL